jgi:hypothetical protein
MNRRATLVDPPQFENVARGSIVMHCMDHVIVGKTLLDLCCVPSACYLVPRVDRSDLSTPRFNRLIFALLVITRVLIFGLLVGFLHGQGTSDVTGYYREAAAALSHKIPFPHISTAYGPLFPYFAALPLMICNSPAAIIALTVIFEIAAMPFWLAIGRRLFGESATRRAGVLYVLNPLVLINVPLTGQNHIWIAFFLAVSIYLVLQGRLVASGLALAASVLVVKFFSLLFAPVFVVLIFREKSWRGLSRWLAAFALPSGICYGYAMAKGLDPIAQIKFHASYNASGSLPYLLSIFGIDFDDPHLRFAANVIGFALLCLFILLLWRAGGMGSWTQGMLVMELLVIVVLLVNKKSFASYLEHAFFALCISVALCRNRTASMALGLFGALAAIEPTLWFRWMHQLDLRILVYPGPIRIPPAQAALFVACEAALLGFYLLYLCQITRQVLRMRDAPGIT